MTEKKRPAAAARLDCFPPRRGGAMHSCLRLDRAVREGSDSVSAHSTLRKERSMGSGYGSITKPLSPICSDLKFIILFFLYS